MDDVRTPDPQEPPGARYGVKDDTPKVKFTNAALNMRRPQLLTSTATTRYVTSRFAQPKNDTATATDTIHRRIFDSIKEIDNSAVIISLDQLRITHGKDMPTEKEYKTVFKDWRKCNVTKREYVSFKLESTQTISQFKYGSYANVNKGIFDTLRKNSAFLRMRK